MKRVNLRLLATAVAAVVVLIVGVYMLRRFQVSRNAGSLIKLARQRQEQGKQLEAIQLLQRYVGLRPQDTAAFGEYAELLLQRTETPEATRADVARAYNVLEDAVRRNPDDHYLRARLAQFQLRIGRPGDARDHLQLLRTRQAAAPDGPVASATSPAEPGDRTEKEEEKRKLTTPDSIALMLAKAAIGSSDFEEAAGSLATIVDYDLAAREFRGRPRPETPTEAFVLLAAILDEKLASKPAAVDVLARLVDVHAEDPQAWLARSRWHRQQGDLAAALADVERAMQIAPENADAVFAAFDVSLSSGDLVRAEEFARKGRDAHPEDDRGYRSLGAVLAQRGELEQAEQILRDGIAALPPRAALLLMLADVLLQRNDLAEAEQTVTRVKETFGQSNPAVGLFDARLLVARQQWIAARRKLLEVRPLVAGSDELTRQVDLYLGQCAEQLGEYDTSLEAHQRVLLENPTSLPARIGAAAAIMAAGKSDEALKEFEEIAAALSSADRLAAVPQVWLPLIQLRVAAQARLPAERRDWARIDALLETLQQSPQVSASQMALLRADILVRKEEFAAATAILSKAAETDPTNPQIATARATLILRREGPDAARGFLAGLPADLAGNPAVLVIDAQVAASAGKEAAAEAFPRIADQVRGMSNEVAGRVLAQLAALSLAVGDRAGAERYWTEAADKQPNDLQARSALFDLALDTNDSAKAAAVAEAIGKTAGVNAALSRVARAAVAILSVRSAVAARQEPGGPLPELEPAERASLDKARNLLIEAENERPGWSRIQALYAELEGLKGDVPASIDRLQRAVSLGATNPALLRQLVSLLYSTNRIDEARTALASLGPETAGLDRLSAEVDMRAGKLEDAVKRAEKTVAADSQNAGELLWLSQLLERSGKRDQAMDVVQRAVAVGPDRPETWLTLLSLQLAQGKQQAAAQTLDRAADSLSGQARLLALAQGSEMLGRLDESERYHRDAVANAADDLAGRRRLAEFLLRRGRLVPAREELEAILAVKATTVADRATQAWARRGIAEMVGEKGTFRDFREALATLQQNADAKGQLSPDDLALKARLLAARPEPENWRAGIAAFRELAAVLPLSIAQRLQITQLQERTGQWEEARTGLISIASSSATPPAILAMVVERLLDHGETADARIWFRRLQSLAAGSPLTAGLEARLAMAAGDREAAANAARRLLPSQAVSPEQVDQLVVVARLYEDLGFFKAADKVLVQAADVSPDGSLARAAFLGRQQQTSAALDLLQSLWDKVPLERLMQVALEVARDGEDEAAAERIEPWFTKAIRQDPESVALPLTLAELHDLQQQPAKTEKLYRDLLARPGLGGLQKAIVTNNLAFHLARPETAAEARGMIDAAIEELGPHPDLLDTRGVVAAAAGDPRAAIRDLQEATLLPTPVKLLHLAAAFQQAGDTKAAAETLEAARKKKLRPTRLSSLDRERLEKLEAALGGPKA